MRTLALSIGVFLALAGSASGASVSVSGFAPGPYGSDNLSGSTIAVTYDAAAGEANDLTVSRDGTGHEYLLFTDTGASSVSFGAWPVSPCTRGTVDPADVHVVRCPLQGATARLTISLGDGDDHAVLHPTWSPYESYVTRADGGAGDDEITADSGMIVGGDGDDTLDTSSAIMLTQIQGGAGRDTITGSQFGDLISGGSGDDVIHAGAGADSLYDNAPEAPSDDGDDLLDGGADGDGIYARGGVDTIVGGTGQDLVYANDALTAPGSPTQNATDTLDCGTESDATIVDAADTTTGCEVVVFNCVGLTTYPWVQPFGPCPAKVSYPPLGGAGAEGGSGAVKPPVTPPVAAPVAAPPPAPAPPPTPPSVPTPPAPLSLHVALDLRRVRPPLRTLPRALIRLSATAEVTVTLAREVHHKRIGLPGSIQRRLGSGEKNISLSVLLGGRQKFAPGRYWITVAARTADGRSAARSAVLRMLRPRR
jgi:hypothetical protein